MTHKLYFLCLCIIHPRRTGSAEGDMLISFQQQTDREHRKCEAYNETAKTVWTRASENARKLALLYACSENPQQPIITEQAVSWALKFIQHQVRRQLYMSGIYAAENDFHANCLKLKEKLMTAKDKRLLRSVLLKRMKMDKDSFNKLIDTLIEQGDVTSIQSNSNTFKGVVYVLCE